MTDSGGPMDKKMAGVRGVLPNPFAGAADVTVAGLATDATTGLTNAEAARRRERQGPNELVETPPEPRWRRLLSQFTELLVVILLIAAAVSAALGEWADAAAILAIVAVNAIIGFLQEDRAARSLESLRRMSAPQARAVRDGALAVVPAAELVPGDVIELEAGDHVPADARLLESFGVRSQESALTGESVPVDKDAAAVLEPATPLAERRNMAYRGTVIAAGKAKAVVVATGMETELGRIAGMLQRAAPEPTPLQRRLAGLGKTLAAVCLVVVGIVFALELWRGGPLLDVFLTAVSLAVAAVPEGLPAVVTIVLALGLQRLVKRNALIRKLPSVETLGSVTVICSDKTGTLTRNEMTVREVQTGSDSFQVTGTGYAPRGQFVRSGAATEPRSHAELVRLLEIAARCNHAQVRPRRDGDDEWEVIGDPTEGALAVAALKGGIGPAGGGEHLLAEIPFDSERKMMSVVVRSAEGSDRMYAKGAPEVILARCVSGFRAPRTEPLTDSRRSEWMRAAAAMAGRGLRVLGLADRELAGDLAGKADEAELVFAGLAGMMDPPREEARAAVRKCHDAGIRPVMITGDHPVTALAVARELGIARESDAALSGGELDELADDELAARVDRIAVYARVAAEHKLRVVRAWKSRGEVVAMTGDGGNDAPAVRAADIGIAMGATGTDVTREAAAMVLTDDNFASIVAAVEEGRGIFDNIQKVLWYLLSCNVGEILLMLTASLLGWPPPLLPVQLLWINLVTDGLPALALALEPAEPDVMRRKPRPPREPILSVQTGLWLVLQGGLIAAAALTGFAIVRTLRPDDVGRARTVAFCVLVYAELFRALAARSRTLTLAQLGLFTNPPLLGAIVVSGLLQLFVVTLPFARPVFESAQEFTWEWVLMFLLALIPVTLIEVAKLVRNAVAQRKGL
jgi:Ca2+-transporting ATPase